MGVEWLNRYVALEKEDNYGVEPGTIIKIALSGSGTNSGWRGGNVHGSDITSGTVITMATGENARFPAAGTVYITNEGGTEVTVTYTAKAGETLTGCTYKNADGSTYTLGTGNSKFPANADIISKGTFTLTSAEGGKGCAGTVETKQDGSLRNFAVTDGGQGFSNTDDIEFVFVGVSGGGGTIEISDNAVTLHMGGQPGDDTSSASRTTGLTNGGNNTNGIIYGEADDESMKQTFELLGRSDMSRQVASKAVTNTQYGEGSVNLAVQPDDFMGNIIYAFLPIEEMLPNTLGSVAIDTAGTGATAGNYILEVKGATTTTENAWVAVTVAGGAMTAVNIVNPGKGITGSLSVVNFATDKDGRATGINAGSPALTLTAGAGLNSHVFNEPTLDTHSYPSYTMRVGREGKEHTFTGMVATKLGISANLNEYVMASVDWVGKNEETPSTLQTNVPFSGLNTDALHFADAEVYFANNANKTIKVQQISFEININRDNDSAYAVGNRSFTRAPPTRTREITGTMEFNEVIHTTTSSEPTYAELTGSSVKILQPDLGAGAIRIKFKNEAGTEYMEFEFYNVRFEAPEASVSGRDPNRMSVGFQCFYDAKQGGAQKAVQALLVGASGGAISTTAYSA